MNWSFSELHKSYKDEPLLFDETLDLTESLKKRFPDVIYDVSPVRVKGMLSVQGRDLLIHADITTELTVASTRSLDPVPFPVDTDMTEFYVEDQAALKRYDENDVAIAIEDDKIDLNTAVEDNIILLIPMQVLSEEERNGQAMPKGSDWAVLSEADLEQAQKENQTVDPRLAKLKDLFPDQEDE